MPSTASSAARSAHRRSVQLSTKDLIDALGEKLGTRLLAIVSAKDDSTISRWRTGRASPTERSVQTLRTAYQVFELLRDAESDHTIRAWFIGMNPQLDDDSPAEALAEGRNREVMAAARAFLAGG